MNATNYSDALAAKLNPCLVSCALEMQVVNGATFYRFPDRSVLAIAPSGSRHVVVQAH